VLTLLPGFFDSDFTLFPDSACPDAQAEGFSRSTDYNVPEC